MLFIQQIFIVNLFGPYTDIFMNITVIKTGKSSRTYRGILGCFGFILTQFRA
jgi:hypothetical protein